jgi:nitrile hydratase
MRKLLKVPNLAVPAQKAGAALPRDIGEPVFAESWQAHGFAMVMSLYRDGHYTWPEWDDYLGHRIQSAGHFGGTPVAAPEPAPVGSNYNQFLADCEKDGRNFYNLWVEAAEDLFDATGLVPKAELEARVADFEKVEGDGPRFTADQKVRVRDIETEGHTHLPLYLRGKIGVVLEDRGVFVFPEATGHGHSHHGDVDTLQHVYGMRFAARDIWGEDASGGHSLNVNLWDYQLEAIT